MFEDTQGHLEEILDLVKLCPSTLQEKCFELLLNAYLNNRPKESTSTGGSNTASNSPNAQGTGHTNAIVPEVIKTRLNSLISRAKAPAENAIGLFDFNTDPFIYHAVSIPGNNKREQMRNVALMLSLKSYLVSTSWTADWKEFRANCIDHGCWDQSNSVTIMKHDWFKTHSAADGISLSPSGIKSAEALFAKLAGATE